MNLPKISIITPSLNQGKYLDETIRSVLDQRYPELEYIIIDGGSSDNSVDIIRKHESKLKFWVSESDRGHGHALNKGFSHSSGEIMGWINSDDKYTSGCLNVVSEIFTKFPHVMWIVGKNSWWDSNGEMTRSARTQKNIYDFLLGRYAWIQQESVFWRRSLWEKAGGYINEDYNFMVDGELWTRFFLHADLYSVDEILSGYRVHSDNRAMKHYKECLREMDRAISTMKKECTENVLSTYKNLNVGILNVPFWKYLPVSIFFRKFIFPTAYMEAGYKNITRQNNKWIERVLPFS
jgi:glycosyltransferase involved in cell wall biosynthesis